MYNTTYGLEHDAHLWRVSDFLHKLQFSRVRICMQITFICMSERLVKSQYAFASYTSTHFSFTEIFLSIHILAPKLIDKTPIHGIAMCDIFAGPWEWISQNFCSFRKTTIFIWMQSRFVELSLSVENIKIQSQCREHYFHPVKYGFQHRKAHKWRGHEWFVNLYISPIDLFFFSHAKLQQQWILLRAS